MAVALVLYPGPLQLWRRRGRHRTQDEVYELTNHQRRIKYHPEIQMSPWTVVAVISFPRRRFPSNTEPIQVIGISIKPAQILFRHRIFAPQLDASGNIRTRHCSHTVHSEQE